MSRSRWLYTVRPSTSRWMCPLKRSTIPFVPMRAGRVGPRRAMLHAQAPARGLKPIGREAGATVGEPLGDAERERLDGLRQEGDGAALGFVVLDRQVDEAGGAVDGHIEIPLTALAV